VCGEGGEYESAVFDCPLFKNKKIVEIENVIVNHIDNDISPVAYIKFKLLEI
jgi:diphthine-ammonia ligase